VSFSIHPNPTPGAVHLQLTEWEGAHIELFDFSARRVMTQQVLAEQTRIDCSSLASGTYIIKVQSSLGLEAQRIVVAQ
jgi:hypothetical protein